MDKETGETRIWYDLSVQPVTDENGDATDNGRSQPNNVTGTVEKDGGTLYYKAQAMVPMLELVQEDGAEPVYRITLPELQEKVQDDSLELQKFTASVMLQTLAHSDDNGKTVESGTVKVPVNETNTADAAEDAQSMDSAESVAPAETAESTAAESAPASVPPVLMRGPVRHCPWRPRRPPLPRMRRTRRKPRPRNGRKQTTHRNFISGKKVALMHRRARSILRGEQGLSMILVLCIGALFVALSAALVYAASVLTANANRQLLEQEAYQLATSFSDVLEGELNKKDSSFAKFVNEQFMFSQSYGKDIYDSGSPARRSSPGNRKAASLMAGPRPSRCTLRRRPGDGADKLNQTANSTNATDLLNLLNHWQGEDRKGMEIVDLQLDITVTVTKNGERASPSRGPMTAQ